MELNLALDPTGWPMVFVPPINAWLGCLPITKIQFEHFLMGTMQPQYDRSMYDQALQMSRRITAAEITKDNYHWAPMSAVTPTEANDYAHWMEHRGDSIHCRLPTQEEWLTVWKHFKSGPSQSVARSVRQEGLKPPPRATHLLERLDVAVFESPRPPALLDDFLMRNGIREWVLRSDGNYGGAGEPHNEFGFGFVDGGSDVSRPRHTEERQRGYGFRLLFKETRI